jgi:hypothetical protein
MKYIMLHIFLVIGIVLGALALSWLGTCGVIWLITLCFDLEFSWLIATGIWLGLALVSGLFRANVTVRK